MRPKLLDLFCGAGGASVGYYRAGFDVEGVDIKPQPHYPFKFYLSDALEFPLEGYDAYHASPPCQFGSVMRLGRWQDRQHPNHIPAIRQRLLATNKPFVSVSMVVDSIRYGVSQQLLEYGVMLGAPVIVII